MENMYGIEYSKPKVSMIQETGIGVAELAARTCYNSFDKSENDCIASFDSNNIGKMNGTNIDLINNIEHSDLLDDLAWTYFHHSILEHATVSYLVEGISRGVLQEHARHRIQAISVQSTRYTMSSVINAFTASLTSRVGKQWFYDKIKDMDMFIIESEAYIWFECESIYNKLKYQHNQLGREGFLDISVAKSSREFIETALDADTLYELLEAGKKKRNVGDAFKHIVTDNWKVDLVITFNLRSLKNYFTLRDSGAAYFQIQWLAQEMKNVTPDKYLDLIIKLK